MHVVLVHPEIAPNTGNIIRLCANTGASLHLVEPLGFELDDRNLRRAGLDYHDIAEVVVHPDLESARTALPGRWLACTTTGARSHVDIDYRADDVAVFGPERAGLDADALALVPTDDRVRIPMMPGNRSLNLANAVAVVVYEAWRQAGFAGAASPR